MEKRPTTHAEVERVPSVLLGMGSPAACVIVFAITGTLLFAQGQAGQWLFPTALAGFSGAMAGVAYFLYKPHNPFSDNFYAPKALTKLTPGELRALNYLNGPGGSLIGLKTVLITGAVPLFGALCWQLGVRLPNARTNPDPYSSLTGLCFLTSGGSAAIHYLFVLYWTLRRRWECIVRNAAVPNRDILAKYAKNAKQLERMVSLVASAPPSDPEEEPIDPDWRDALEGRLTWTHVRVILNLVFGGIAVITAVRLISGGVVEGRETAAVLVAGASAALWFATRKRGH